MTQTDTPAPTADEIEELAGHECTIDNWHAGLEAGG